MVPTTPNPDIPAIHGEHDSGVQVPPWAVQGTEQHTT